MVTRTDLTVGKLLAVKSIHFLLAYCSISYAAESDLWKEILLIGGIPRQYEKG